MDFSYKEKQIKSLNKEDLLIALSGMIVNIGNNSFVLDDGSGQVGVFFEDTSSLNKGYVRVFGRLMSYEQGIEIQADFVQDLNKIDKQLHKRVISLLE